MSRRLLLSVLLIAGLACPAFGQGNPTGGISGKITDPDGLALPGVTVTASSPVLQGARTAVSSENGDYIIPFLPPGLYEVVYELSGFQTIKREGQQVVIGETIPVNARMTIAAVTETVEVTGTASTEIAPNLTVASTYKSETIELLPVGRTLNSAVLLAPGVQDNGPSGNIMVSGATSFENLFLINGVVVNENLRGQARNLFIEDAIQETKTSTASISAEYGRFQGGVINMITKSGGNRFSGSFRVTFVNDAWSALTPYPGDFTVDKVVPAYELTAGGPILRDKLWFFAAGRFEVNEGSRTTDYTSFNYVRTDDEKRYEGKLTYAITSRDTAKFSYIKRKLETANNSFGTIMDARSLYDNANDEELISANYTGVLTDKWFLEGQYSQRGYAIIGSGGTKTDLPNGTPIWDRSRGQARFNAPTFCAVCGSGVEDRNNWNVLLKTNYFLSTQKTGSHNFVTGFDAYKEMRRNDNYQSGSSYRIQATRSIIQGQDIYPVFVGDGTTYVEYLPLVEKTKGNDIRTYSFFANDTWRLNGNLTFNLGLRYDRNRSKDQSGAQVVEDSAWSPRLGATWDIKGNGVWVANAGFARYVAGVSTAIVDAGSAGGRTATFSYAYQGPSVNTGSGPYLTAEQALPILFDWFFANGGTSRATRTAPNIPGVTTKVGENLRAPNSNEWMAGLARQLGNRGLVRADFIYKDFADGYGDFRDLSTGKVTDPTGRVYDLTIVRNDDTIRRAYRGLSFQASYRVGRDWQFGGNYTLSWLKANFAGEDTGSGPIRFSGNDQPEYKREQWSYPYGYLNDQRHKVRAWVQYQLPMPDALGRWDLGLLQRFDASEGSSEDGTAFMSTAYMPNPGYQTTPSSVTYYFGPRGAIRYDDVWRTDLSLAWSMPIPALGRTQLFFRGVINNLFNNAAQTAANETILTRSNSSAIPAFNPFTETPVLGTHYFYGPDWGLPTGTGDYQAPRDFSFSVGVRF
jgi:outer membrane receptor protein involved in Fe transport